MLIIIASIIGSVLALAAIIIYCLIVLGIPLGDFAFGGKYKVPPIGLRIACAASILVQLFMIIILLQIAEILPLWFSLSVTRIICFVFAGYLTLNTVMNFFSKSKKEKWIATPMAMGLSACHWIVAFNA